MIEEQTVLAMAELARIGVDPEEVEGLTGQLQGILAWVAQLEEVNTQTTEPLYGLSDWATPRREDEITAGGDAPTVLRESPERVHEGDGGFFVVPKVVE